MRKTKRLKIKRGICEACGHNGGLVPMTSLCGACAFGEAAAQLEYDGEIGKMQIWKSEKGAPDA